MWTVKDKTGMRFGMLTVVSRAEDRYTKKGRKQVAWLCKCDCGNYKVILSGNLKECSTTKSCGCYKKKVMSSNTKRTTHGMSKTRIYREWQSMIWRCYTKTNTSYKNYGQRGICVCDSWKNDFNKFYKWSISSGYQDDLTLDRIDNNGDYEPDNCRWVSTKVQGNNKRNNKYLEYNGEKHSYAEWSYILGSNDRHLVSDRLDRGWSIEKTLTTPIRNRRF